ncbi:MAG: DUF6527 family protein [Coriobacteriia bacterium]
MKLHATHYHTSVEPDVERPIWLFWCPACEMIHQLDERWTVGGTDEAPTVEGSYLQYGSKHDIKALPRCHLFIRDGQLQYLSDCSHALAGQTIPMPELPKWAYSTDYEE